MKKCPFCAEEIQDDAVVCRYCRSNLVTKPQATLRRIMVGVCPKCLEEFPISFKTCTNHFFTKLQPEQREAPVSADKIGGESKSESERKRNAWIIFSSIGLFFVCLIVFHSYFSPQPPSEEPKTYHPDSGAFRDGYILGMVAGKWDGSLSPEVPSRTSLEGTAQSFLSRSEFAKASDSDRERWKNGFLCGYEDGFKEVAKPAW